MAAALSSFFIAFTALFVVVEPIGVAPLFAAMTRGRPREEVLRTARRAALTGGAILFVFALGGRVLLDALGVRIDAFRMAGGLLLLLAALDMIRAKEPSCRCGPAELKGNHDDIAIIPFATPLLAGPGAMATVMMLVARAPDAASTGAVFLAVAVTFFLTWLLLRSATFIERFIGPSVGAVLQRVLGLVLAAMSLQYIVDGGMALLRDLRL